MLMAAAIVITADTRVDQRSVPEMVHKESTIMKVEQYQSMALRLELDTVSSWKIYLHESVGKI